MVSWLLQRYDFEDFILYGIHKALFPGMAFICECCLFWFLFWPWNNFFLSTGFFFIFLFQLLAFRMDSSVVFKRNYSHFWEDIFGSWKFLANICNSFFYWVGLLLCVIFCHVSFFLCSPSIWKSLLATENCSLSLSLSDHVSFVPFFQILFVLICELCQ